ncbi:hypothetical protein [Bifidobacterium sp. ESL0745]|uniref:hypothetical protein n=1 Tax=Bifidobacterium sp. ESL0745 TaxID=2983226 RepID=UPI0023F91FCB|nr:hypothetical protein [Bifidobacterium sp. ESL0745]MDF7665731.1 hypothetical protein [Bifidobacterium sp. ESL0745]
MKYVEARQAVMGLLPKLEGWDVYIDGPPPKGSPPWIVALFSEKTRDHVESGRVTNHQGELSIRVVGPSDTGIGIVCDKLISLDGARPHKDMSCLVADIDRSYPSELINPATNAPYQMRVMTWLTSWPA